MSTLDVRRERLSRFVRRTVAQVRESRGWTLTRLLEAAQVDKPVYYRWVNGSWTGDLEPSALERFCDAAGVPVAEPLRILWPGAHAAPPAAHSLGDVTTTFRVKITVEVDGPMVFNSQNPSQLGWDCILVAGDNPEHYVESLTEAIEHATQQTMASVVALAAGRSDG